MDYRISKKEGRIMTNTYIIVDSNNHWLHYGELNPEDQAEVRREASMAEDYDPTATLYVYHIDKGIVYEPEIYD